MATLDDLVPSILELSEDDAINLIREVRKKRRIIPEKKTKAKAKAKERPLNIDEMIANISPDKAAELIKLLEGES